MSASCRRTPEREPNMRKAHPCTKLWRPFFWGARPMFPSLARYDNGVCYAGSTGNFRCTPRRGYVRPRRAYCPTCQQPHGYVKSPVYDRPCT